MDLISLIFPKTCLGCGREGKYICRLCIDRIPFLKQLCPYCEKAALDGVTHSKCLKKLRLNGVFSVWAYEGVVRTAILKLKYKFAKEIAKELSEYMAIYLVNQPIFPKNSILTPIPLYFLKENFRGFNQSELIGELLADQMGWNFNSDILIRKRLRRPQTELKGKERRENVRGVFAFNSKHKLTNQPINKSFLLFDDVYTTGSTLKEAAKVLKRRGAGEVWGLTIAR
ncbi:hypothetical protein A2865_01975 [Candidatus Woesebacteria bacterium RIFCSPHIGHO2_01_FULL_39_17]|nr:MAG: ComF family protein [Microgenomates group bacterium GW2011_GWC1_38_12]OGM23082.1 MAG: hypothetical protein A2865_01975 [Candidatus Woesebacteria bacterium RIFCSPHIGHO2_01_FULL_39_17]